MLKKKAIEISASEESFDQAQALVEQVLAARRVNLSIATQTMLLFEALFLVVISQINDENTTIEIVGSRKLGRTEIKIGFPGKRFAVPEGDAFLAPETKIIQALSDKLSCSYLAGYNVIRISVEASAKAFIVPNLIAVVLGIVLGAIISFALEDATQHELVHDWIGPLEKLFTNAMMMVGAPMTLFSLLKNATDSFVLSERHSFSQRLFVVSLSTSVVAIALATFLGFAFARTILALSGVTESVDIGLNDWSLADVVDQIIPSSILEPFETISPVPMIVVALLVTYALCSIGPSFELMKSLINAFYDLFSRILRIVMAAFPVACFLFFLDAVLSEQFLDLAIMLLVIVSMVYFCTLFLFATYGVRLKANGIKVGDFVKKLRPLVKENFAIGSAIEAVPYNVRYCAKHFGFPRERLEKELPVMAQTNLDGNGFIIMLLTMFYIFLTNGEISWVNIMVIGAIVLLLSFGAPNQPGSILIGMLIVFAYLDSEAAVSMAICFELFCGGLQNIINVISGIVTVAENEVRESGKRVAAK